MIEVKSDLKELKELLQCNLKKRDSNECCEINQEVPKRNAFDVLRKGSESLNELVLRGSDKLVIVAEQLVNNGFQYVVNGTNVKQNLSSINTTLIEFKKAFTNEEFKILGKKEPQLVHKDHNKWVMDRKKVIRDVCDRFMSSMREHVKGTDGSFNALSKIIVSNKSKYSN